VVLGGRLPESQVDSTRDRALMKPSIRINADRLSRPIPDMPRFLDRLEERKETFRELSITRPAGEVGARKEDADRKYPLSWLVSVNCWWGLCAGKKLDKEEQRLKDPDAGRALAYVCVHHRVKPFSVHPGQHARGKEP
jgi:hypothetical protein